MEYNLMMGSTQKTSEEPGAASARAHYARRARVPAIVIGSVVAVALLIVGASSFFSQRTAWPESLVSGSAKGFSVLLISLDTTRADYLGCYGRKGAATPHLDGLAAQGIRFENAVTVAPITLPAHTSILTGLLPPNHGVHHNGAFALDARHRTLAEVLHDRGYQTGAFVSAFVLAARFGLDQGFDLYEDRIKIDSKSSTVLAHSIYERSATQTTDVAIEWLESRDRSRPFFSWVHYFDPHRPHKLRSRFAKRFAGRPYDGEIAYMDSQIGRLIQTLRKLGELDRTLVIVVGDHGEGMDEHNEHTHAMLIYDSVMRVPLILNCPGVFRGKSVVDDVVVSVTDVFPTVLDLLGIDYDGPMDGQSLLAARTDTERAVYMESLAPYLDYGWAPLYGLHRHEDVFILAPQPEYYDVRADPGQLNDLYQKASGTVAGTRDELVRELDERLAQWPSIEGVVASLRPMDAESLKALQSLGYVGSVAQVDADTELANPKDMMPVWRAIDRANGLSGKGNYDQALSILQEVQAAAPDIPRVLLMMGKLYLYMGRTAEARDILQTAMDLLPSTEIAIVAAQAMLEAGHPGQAAEILEQARPSAPGDVGLLASLGVAYLHSDRLEEAKETLLEAERVDDTSLEVCINLAACYRRMGNPTEALHYVDKAIALSPETAQAHITRGLILKGMRQYEEALSSLRMAFDLDARNPTIVQELANVCMRLRLYEEAATHFQAMSQLLPTRWEPHLGLGNVYLMLERIDEAIAEVRVGLRMAPNEPRLRALARRLAELQNP